MNQRIKQLWLKLLKTSEKATGFLKRKDGSMCCMGVLCELYAKEVKEEKPWYKTNPLAFKFLGKSANLAPKRVLDWAGLTILDQYTLTDLNDGNPGYPIKEIKAL